MEESRSSGRAKRPAKPVDEGSWDCSVCTYKNSAEAYKCEMCDVRKGTSTRKPKINPQIVAQQVAQQFAAPLTPPPPGSLNADEDSLTSLPEMEPLPDPLGPPPPPPKIAPKKEKSATQSLKREKSNVAQRLNSQPQQKKNNSRPTRLKNIDRSSGQQMSVTVDNVTVVITDYPPKRRKISSDPSKNSILSDASDTSSNASNDIHEERMLGENHT